MNDTQAFLRSMEKLMGGSRPFYHFPRDGVHVQIMSVRFNESIEDRPLHPFDPYSRPRVMKFTVDFDMLMGGPSSPPSEEPRRDYDFESTAEEAGPELPSPRKLLER